MGIDIDASLEDLGEPDGKWAEEELMVDDADDYPAVCDLDTLNDDVKIHVGKLKMQV